MFDLLADHVMPSILRPPDAAVYQPSNVYPERETTGNEPRVAPFSTNGHQLLYSSENSPPLASTTACSAWVSATSTLSVGMSVLMQP